MVKLEDGARLCGRYTLLRRLGRGGMAEVWLAEDAQAGGRVALKCLLPEFAAQPTMLRLFEQECRRVARLGHPHIVRVLAWHGDASPPCFAMEFVEGPDLRAVRGRPAAELAALLAPVADALGRVHALGLVHRDLKPSNVLLDADGRARLTDFGIAAALETVPGEPQFAGGGSATFASPEQRAGLPPAVGDDAWAFGRLISELLAPEDLDGPLAALAGRLTAPEAAARLTDFDELRDRLHRIAGDVIAGESGAGEAAAGEPLAARRPAGLRSPGLRPAASVGAGGRGAPRWLWGALAVLVALLGGVVFLLPDWVAERRAAAPSAERAAPAAEGASETSREAPADEIRRLVEARRAADALRERLDLRVAALEERAVTQWATEEFSALQSQLVAGEAAYARRDYAGAVADWEAALAAAEALETARPGVVTAALAAGREALDAGWGPAATEAFELAAAADPGNAAAAAGLKRAATLDEVLALMATGTAAERDGRQAAARDAYAAAVALDPVHAPAAAALSRLEAAAGEAAYQGAMSRGFAALDSGDPAAARSAFEAARRLRPGSAAAAEGLGQAEAMRRNTEIERWSGTARTAEAGERWTEAAEAWRKVLAEQATEQAAVAGLQRATARAELAARLERFLADPFRLTQENVFEAAQAALAEARAASAPFEALRARADALAAALTLAATPVTVAFESDGRTEVVVHRVGRLGAFQRRTLELKPGRYTAVGSRPGYRDVRREFTVEMGRPMPGPVVVRSEEPI
jgi:eukaryotic-like serine/threonine-protein kinase